MKIGIFRSVFILAFLICVLPTEVSRAGPNTTGLSNAHATRTKLLMGSEYFRELRRAIRGSKESIYITMYLMMCKGEGKDELSDPVGILVEDLISAHKRGVEVRVILEDGRFQKSYNAYKRLVNEGIWVGLDSPSTLLHSKVVVIDGMINIFGSANWTKAAFYSNYEASVFIESEDFAGRFIEEFSRIKLVRFAHNWNNGMVE